MKRQKKIILLIVLITAIATNSFGQCTSLFSFAAYFETVTFINQSNVSNAHYFWNFGDGTGSNFQNPVHKFPDTGNYLVTLFAKDTISNCSSYYEYWVNVNKYSTDSCQTSITDSIFFYNTDYYLKIIDNSINCNNYLSNYDIGADQNGPPNSWFSLYGPARFVSRVQYYGYDTISSSILLREAYNTVPFLYTSAKNYDDCSANFEFTVVSQDTIGQTILFKAMNKTASYYEWSIVGLGNPITSNYDTISQFYPFNENDLWRVRLNIQGSTGCHDTLFQNILVRNVLTIASVDEIENKVIYKLFPNPFINQATLEFPSTKEKTSFTLYGYNGQLVKRVDNITSGRLTIYRDGLPSGLYFFILSVGNRVIITGKMIAE